MEVRGRFRFLDASITSILFAPIVVLFWHGSFAVLDNIILRESPYYGAITIIAIGIAIQVSSSCIQDNIHSFVANQPVERHKALVLMYNFILGFAQILQFRGLNDLYEQNIGVNVSDAISATVTSVVLLCALKLCSQTVDIPFVLGLDTNKPLADSFRYTSYHGTRPGLTRDHILDAISTIAVLQTCVHIFAIASWIAVDSGFFKEIPFLAMVTSWLGGYSLFIVFWVFSHFLQDLSRKFGGDEARTLVTRFFVDLMLIGEGLGVIMMWHGHWVLYDVMAYWFPISLFGHNLTPYLEVICAFALLSLCHISSCLVRSGIFQDEIDANISCIGMNATYFSHFFEDDIKKTEKNAVENNNEQLNDEVSKQQETIKRQVKKDGLESKPKKKVSLQDLVDLDRQKQKSKKTK